MIVRERLCDLCGAKILQGDLWGQMQFRKFGSIVSVMKSVDVCRNCVRKRLGIEIKESAEKMR